MDENLKKQLEEQIVKIDAIYKSVEKTRKYFVTMLWVTLGAVILPLIGLAFAIPAFLNNYVGTLTDLGI
ncbi:MAG: hypothetical protein UU24_C0021G0010 [Candidatus Nomurabacteria bacterium GW2011_GWA2_40_9]|uniref:Uncharacterized protein n=1 Tax=Candidatus Nomurabacteria bacterium GW2011_GWA2_40_9 TaxID=1618734 RepID=A0A0G0TVU9_9BACT|nr:MAG: hypothetical protein UU24_C0021G0010 [Candidatus Nomurabacteria bacterium GW2011_GWA2_40_9]